MTHVYLVVHYQYTKIGGSRPTLLYIAIHVPGPLSMGATHQQATTSKPSYLLSIEERYESAIYARLKKQPVHLILRKSYSE